MTAIAAPLPALFPTKWNAAVQAALLAAGLGAIVTGRWAATWLGFDPLAVGLAFGLALAALALAGGFGARAWDRSNRRRILTSRPAVRAVIAGALFGLALVGAGVLGPSLAGAAAIPGLGRASFAFLPWAGVTVVVAVAEEAILRGILFDRLARAGGALLALGLTTALFALMHVPVYGWHVVPLDLAVGLGLGGLRLGTRSIAAPASAHVFADLATWWL
jgi:membrane protease YdiL (CAAX protease family)